MKQLILASLCVMFASTVAMGDWDPGDPYKMHFPQLPDPCGLDVAFDSMETLRPLGDDWLCTETGPVKDIHFWVSWKGDLVSDIVAMKVEIYDNNPEGPWGFSTPGTQLWSRDLYLYNPDTCEPDFSMILYSYGPQGWLDPFCPIVADGPTASIADHYGIWQINIPDINRPYEQEEGNIYWLVITPEWADENEEWPGWKTADVDAYPDPFTGAHFLDDAVYYDGEYWQELRECTQESLDLAFVITPEPTTVALLGLGSLVLLRKRRALI